MSLGVTITDIANELNTTPATVSRALNNHPSISEKRKKIVLETASRLKYKRNKIASSLRLGQSRIIGVIIPSAEINFFGSVVHGIESLANKSGYNILIYQSNESMEQEAKGIETFLSARLDGILVSIAKDTTEYSHFLSAKDSNIPIIFFDRANNELGIHSVVIDDYKGAFIATEHLIQQGYKRIAHISGPSHLKIFSDRLKGYQDALRAHKISVEKDLIYQGNVSIEAGRKGILHFLEMKNPPDAVFAVEDFTALGAIKELKDHAIRIPDDFGIIGFANEAFGEHITPTLSTIDQQTVKMGQESFKLLMQLMTNNSDTIVSDQRVVLEPVPIFRNSSLRLKPVN
ncbi:MAG: LacI family DNA-binding transcriptional regulator [Bacteroidota bacterium]